MEKPAYSTDLNPVKKFWDALGCAVYKRLPLQVTLRCFKIALQEKCRLQNSLAVAHLVTSITQLEIFCKKSAKKIQSADILQKSTENLQKWVDDFCSS